MSDIEMSFTFLRDNIPGWLQQLADIEEKVAQMREEMAKIPVSRSPPMRRRTGSVDSIRDLDAIMEDPSAHATPQQSPVVGRKRKTPSVLSGQPSGPLKYRSRTMVIVQYDGQIQKSFETIVRNIGTGRNMLRKGKMAAKMAAFAKLADDDSSEDDEDDVMAKISYRHRTGLSAMRPRAGLREGATVRTPIASTQETFDASDKSLESAQGLCERAAHLSLRDGDCRKELEAVSKHFQDILATATKEVARVAEQKEKEAAKETPKEAAESEAITTIAAAKPTVPRIPSGIASVQTTAKAVDIEIDDESDDDDFVMPPIRLTSRV